MIHIKATAELYPDHTSIYHGNSAERYTLRIRIEHDREYFTVDKHVSDEDLFECGYAELVVEHATSDLLRCIAKARKERLKEGETND